MSRQTQSTPVGPWWSRPSFFERRLMASLRPREDGGWQWGTHPARACSRGCGLLYDPCECGPCPGCMAYDGHAERQRWADIALDALIPTNNIQH